MRPVSALFVLSLAFCVPPLSAQTCYTEEQLLKARERINSLREKQLEQLESHVKTGRELGRALESVNDCRKSNNMLDGVFSALTLQGDPCKKEINQYNYLVQQSDIEEKTIETLGKLLNTMQLTYNSAYALRCNK
jgi:hypothetical protein